jgi:hypothetical protein
MSKILASLAVLGLVSAFLATPADAAYCARFVGGKERMTSGVHAHCDFASMSACRAAVRERGGGHCYKAGTLK